MAIELIDKIKQKNGGKFKLVDLQDVDYDGNGTDTKIIVDEIKNDVSTRATKQEIMELRQQVSNIVANNNHTDGNSELIDLRTNNQGLVLQSAGENLRRVESTTYNLERVKNANKHINTINNGNSVELTNYNNDYFTANFTFIQPSSWAYVSQEFRTPLPDILENPYKVTLVVRPDKDMNIVVCLNNAVNWPNGIAWERKYSIKGNEDNLIELDLANESVRSFLEDKSRPRNTLFCLIVANGRSDLSATQSTGTYQLNWYFLREKEVYEPKAISELSKRSLLSENSLESNHAQLSEHALTSNTSEFAKTCDVAYFSNYAGVKLLNSSSILGSKMSVTLDPENVNKYIITHNAGETTQSTWYGCHLKIAYNDLKDLDCDFMLNFELLSGETVTNLNIVKGVTDWNSVNYPIGIYELRERPQNLYQLIMNCKSQNCIDYYTNAKELYICLGYYNSNSETLATKSSKWSIFPQLKSSVGYVLATDVADECANRLITQANTYTDSLMEDVRLNLNPFKSHYFATVGEKFNTQTLTKVSNYYHVKYTTPTSIPSCCAFKTGIIQDGTVEYIKFFYRNRKANAFLGVGEFNWSLMNKSDIAISGSDIFESIIVPTNATPVGREIKVLVGNVSGTEVDIDVMFITSTDYLNTYTLSSFSENSALAEKSNLAYLSYKSLTSLNTVGGGVDVVENGKFTVCRLQNSEATNNYSFSHSNGVSHFKLEKGNPYWAVVLGHVLGSKEDLANKKLVLNFQNLNTSDNQTTPKTLAISASSTNWVKAVRINTQFTFNEPIVVNLNDYIYSSVFDSATTLCFVLGYERGNSTSDLEGSLFNTKVEIKYTVGLIDESPTLIFADKLNNFEPSNYLTKEEVEDKIANVEFNPEVLTNTPLGIKIFASDNFTSKGLPFTKTNMGIHINKQATEGNNTNWLGAYLRIEYENFEDLDQDLIFNITYLDGEPFNTAKIINKNMSDWGVQSNSVDIKSTLDKGRINLYEHITKNGGSTNLEYYQGTNVLFIVFAIFNGFSFNYNTISTDYLLEPYYECEDSVIIASDLSTQGIEKVKTQIKDEVIDEVIKEIPNASKYITCWGDSLTAGGGWTNRLQQLTGLTVYNGGTGGENSRTIMARQGGDVMMINNITIPATTDPVTIATRSTDGGIMTEFGHKVTPLLQGGSHVNPCYIGDVKGTLKWTGSAHNDITGIWTFTRTDAGQEVVINRPTAIRTDFDINKNAPRIMIIFIGQNGGYNDLDDLVRQHRLMIDHSKATDFIVLGLSSGTKSQRADYEARMLLEFGRRFISLRDYLSQYGLEDAGIEPTEQDLQMMANGQTPQSLLSDSVHYNNECKTVIGNLIYKRLKDLNIV